MTTMPSYPLLAPSCRRWRTARRGRGAPAGRRCGGAEKIGTPQPVGWENRENPINTGVCGLQHPLEGAKMRANFFQKFLVEPVDKPKSLVYTVRRQGKL